MPGASPVGLPMFRARTAYGGGVTRSDLALAALACAAVPGMKPVSVVGVNIPQHGDAPRYQLAHVTDATERTWVIRVPLDAAAGAAIEQNDALVRLLGRHVPFKVPAPAGYAVVGPEGRAAVYPYVEGAALDLAELPGGQGLATAVGRATAAVHNIPRGVFEELAVPVFSAEEVRSRRLADLDRAAETGLVPTGLLARWEEALNATPMWQFSTTPVHGRLNGQAFLVAFSDQEDASTGRVVALTGWDEARIGDPAEDFADLASHSEPEAFDSAIDAYSLARSQRPDGYLVYRARLASEMRLITALKVAYAMEDREGIQWIADRLRRLDRLTTGDDSLVPRTALVLEEPDWRAADIAAEDTSAAEENSLEDSGASVATADAPAADQSVADQIEPVPDAEDLQDEDIQDEDLHHEDLHDESVHDEDDVQPDSLQDPAGPVEQVQAGQPGGTDDDNTDNGQDESGYRADTAAEDPDHTPGGAVTAQDDLAEITASDPDHLDVSGYTTEDTDEGTDRHEDRDEDTLPVDQVAGGVEHEVATGSLQHDEPFAPRTIPEPDPADRTEEIPLVDQGPPEDAEVESATGSAADRERLRTLYDMPEDFPDSDIEDDLDSSGLDESDHEPDDQSRG